MHVVVAGAGHAAVQLAASLRQGGFSGEITLVGDEPGLPYQRPPLSKAYLAGEMDEPALALRPANFYAAQHIDLLAGERITGIDHAARKAHLASGPSLTYDHLVLATGATNRTLPIRGAEHALALRSLDEARTLRARLATAHGVAVIGAGFIGLEFAAVAAARGLPVTVIEMAPRPLLRGVSTPMATLITNAHAAWGTKLLTSTAIRQITPTSVQTTDGATIEADLILAAIGVTPNTMLATNLPTANGITVDANLLTADPAISAIGDCASFPGPVGPIRLESVQNAVDQARCVADRLLGRPTAYAKLPWFWSDQATLRLQIAGLATNATHFVPRGDPASGQISIFCFDGDRLLAVESLNRPTDHMAARRLLAGNTILTPEQAADPGYDLRG